MLTFGKDLFSVIYLNCFPAQHKSSAKCRTPVSMSGIFSYSVFFIDGAQ